MKVDFQRVSEASLEQPPVQRSELDRLQHLVAADVFLPGEVGEGAGNFQDAVVGAGGEVHLPMEGSRSVCDSGFSGSVSRTGLEP